MFATIVYIILFALLAAYLVFSLFLDVLFFPLMAFYFFFFAFSTSADINVHTVYAGAFAIILGWLYIYLNFVRKPLRLGTFWVTNVIAGLIVVSGASMFHMYQPDIANRDAVNLMDALAMGNMLYYAIGVFVISLVSKYLWSRKKFNVMPAVAPVAIVESDAEQVVAAELAAEKAATATDTASKATTAVATTTDTPTDSTTTTTSKTPIGSDTKN